MFLIAYYVLIWIFSIVFIKR